MREMSTSPKVKTRFIIADLGMSTIETMAAFYEVSEDKLLSVIKEHEEELLTDGVSFGTNSEIQEYLSKGNGYTYIIFNKLGDLEIGLEDGRVLSGADTSTLLFPRRAVLRVGMLLEESKVAEEVRNYLFNVELQTTPKQKVNKLEEEQAINLKVGNALMSGDTYLIEEALKEQEEYKNRNQNN